MTKMKTKLVLLLLCIVMLTSCKADPLIPPSENASEGVRTVAEPSESLKLSASLQPYTQEPYTGEENNIFTYPDRWPAPSEYTPNREISGELTIMSHDMYGNLGAAAAVKHFSATHPNIKVNLVNGYSKDDPYGEKFLSQVSVYLMSGESPDLVDLTFHNSYNIARKGFFEDLYTYIDNDADLKREEFYENILKALEIDGKLYRITPLISSTTAGIDKDYYFSLPEEVRNKNSIHYVTMIDLYQSYLDVFSGTKFFKSVFGDASLIASTDTARFMNYDTKVADFGDDFKKYVTLATQYDTNTLKKTLGMSTNEGDCLFMTGDTSDIFECFDYVADRYTRQWFVDSVYDEKTFHSFGELAIPTNAKNKEAAWEFIKYMLMNQYGSEQLYMGQSIHRPSFFKTVKFPAMYYVIQSCGTLSTSKQQAIEELMDKLDQRNAEADYYGKLLLKDLYYTFDVMADIADGIITLDQAAQQMQERFTIILNE